MTYEKEYKNRATAKKHSTRKYSPEELNEIVGLIEKYYEVEFPNESINTNPAYFIPLADTINEAQFNSKEAIKPKYLCEIYNGLSDSKKKNIEKMNNIKAFLMKWVGMHQKKDQLMVATNGVISDWYATANTSTPQWADYIAIPLDKGKMKHLTCDVFTKSKYYRFGFKFLLVDGKLFGDGSIQSQDNNFVIHIGKNFTENEIFITTYRNGILEKPDKYTNIIPKNNSYKCDLYIDAESFFHFSINGQEVYKSLVNKEIHNRAYMLAWGDGNKYEVKVKNIKLETERV
ncbi:hypothetical protein [Ferruginibacter sp.]|nr:hypothetical protein [Ferruginibacter sp.]